MGEALNKPAKLLPVPIWMLKIMGFFVGRLKLVSRLVGSLQVDISKNYQLLGWKPMRSMTSELQNTAKYFEQTNHQK